MRLIHPLPILVVIWEDLSMDFLLVKGQSVIMVIVDRLTKLCHLGSLSVIYSASSFAKFFIHNIV